MKNTSKAKEAARPHRIVDNRLKKPKPLPSWVHKVYAQKPDIDGLTLPEAKAAIRVLLRGMRDTERRVLKVVDLLEDLLP